MQSMRKLMLGVAVLFATVLPALAQGAKPTDTYKVALQVSESDPKILNLALNNVENMIAEYKKLGKKVEVVAYGPGLDIFREDKSPVKARVQTIGLANQNVTFSACTVTHGKAEKSEGHAVKIMSEAKMVPSGVLRLVELQRNGWAYIKP
ncbi:MAG: DsrE family protein [Hyphomicrobiaceae bacterium]|nr:DsrE family protein [Hyphomicrobiaceae bacterium]